MEFAIELYIPVVISRQLFILCLFRLIFNRLLRDRYLALSPTVKPSCPGQRPQSVNTDCLPRLRDPVLKIEVTISGQGGT